MERLAPPNRIQRDAWRSWSSIKLWRNAVPLNTGQDDSVLDNAFALIEGFEEISSKPTSGPAGMNDHGKVVCPWLAKNLCNGQHRFS